MASSSSSNAAAAAATAAGGMATTCIALVVAFVVLSLLFGTLHSTPPLFSSFALPTSSSSSSVLSIACNVSLPPLKIYMYDLPRRFNLGMLDRRAGLNQTPPSAANLPRWSYNAGLGRQHSVEYWMMASLLLSDAAATNATAEEEMEAVRVLDPEQADAFFVPFFSSLSFNINGHSMTDAETEVDRLLQVSIIYSSFNISCLLPHFCNFIFGFRIHGNFLSWLAFLEFPCFLAFYCQYCFG